uniref:adhesion G protein-coupled receptor E3-like n=1 Tax=Ciona intestinalis TaxID=7719 RepID=UPI000EF53836|nr:adhesion G protein-coupled receptor E3-like [Ciona intestinalis]|eukprot:XP_026689892.1 adhesion G protein-coupled receptor E3-like [Ciona intestinalis]
MESNVEFIKKISKTIKNFENLVSDAVQNIDIKDLPTYTQSEDIAAYIGRNLTVEMDKEIVISAKTDEKIVIAVNKFKLSDVASVALMGDSLSSNSGGMNLDTFVVSPHVSITIHKEMTRKRFSSDISIQFTVMESMDLIRNNVSGGFGEINVITFYYTCVFIDTEKGKYSTEGCTSKFTKDGVLCNCNHTTVFAVLFSVKYNVVPMTVKIVTFVCEAISIVCLLLTILILTHLRKHIRGDRTMVQINLSISLLLLHLFTIIHDAAIQNDFTCRADAVLIHYFLLSSATWMMLEGVTLFVKTTDKSLEYANLNARKVNATRLIIGWGVPFIVVATTASISFNYKIYMNSNPPDHGTTYRTCWLSSQIILYSVVIPVAIILTINSVMLIKVAHFVCKMTSEMKNFQVSAKQQSESPVNINEITATMKALFTLFPILGIPWVISMLVGIGDKSTVIGLMFVNAVVNGLQGLLLFLLFCLNATEVRKLLITRWQRGPLQQHRSISSQGATATTTTA